MDNAIIFILFCGFGLSIGKVARIIKDYYDKMMGNEKDKRKRKR